jgi:DNA modification methylase
MKPDWQTQDGRIQLYCGDSREAMKSLPDESVHCCVTSPPYWGLRDYGVAGQLGLEKTPEEYVAKMVTVFREVWRVLRKDGTAWLNLGDSYASGKGTCHNPGGNTSSFNVHLKEANVHPLDRGNKSTLAAVGLKPKDLIGIPWRVAFALQADGWYLRQDIIWHKPNPMPESVTDRCTKSHEYIFLLTKSAQYYYDADAIKETAVYGGNEARYARAETANKSLPTAERNGIRPRSWNGSDFHDGKNLIVHPNVGQKRRSVKRGDFNGKTNALEGREAFRAITETRNRRSVWTVATQPFKDAHFATFPPKLILPCLLAGCKRHGVVLDPFGGAGTTAVVAGLNGRNAILCELNPKYIEIARKRIEIELQQGVLDL